MGKTTFVCDVGLRPSAFVLSAQEVPVTAVQDPTPNPATPYPSPVAINKPPTPSPTVVLNPTSSLLQIIAAEILPRGFGLVFSDSESPPVLLWDVTLLDITHTDMMQRFPEKIAACITGMAQVLDKSTSAMQLVKLNGKDFDPNSGTFTTRVLLRGSMERGVKLSFSAQGHAEKKSSHAVAEAVELFVAQVEAVQANHLQAAIASAAKVLDIEKFSPSLSIMGKSAFGLPASTPSDSAVSKSVEALSITSGSSNMISSTTDSSARSKSSTHGGDDIGLIGGAAGGGVCVLLLAVLVWFKCSSPSQPGNIDIVGVKFQDTEESLQAASTKASAIKANPAEHDV